VSALLLGAGFLALGSVAPEGVPQQLRSLALSLAVCAGLLWLGKGRVVRLTAPLYLLAVLSLVLTRFLGTEANGARSWLSLGPLPSFQPSEFAKLAVILALAGALRKRELRTPLDYLKVGALVGVPFSLVLSEPDLGSALVIAAAGLLMSLVRGVPRAHLPLFTLLLLAALPTTVWPNLEPHQRARLTSFVKPDAEPLGSGYQVIQARIAVGSGGLWGQGYGEGTQAQNGFLPFPATDFIFPVLAEEGGFVAAAGVLLLYGALFTLLAAMAGACPEPRDQLLITGVIALLGFQALTNVGMTLGLVPVTGVTLPLISLGGSSLLSTLAALTLAFVVYRERYVG